MKNCRDCLHFKACYEMAAANNADEFCTMFAEKCEDFTNRSEWVHLPCKVGDKVYQTDGIRIYESTIRAIEISSARTVYFTENIAFDKRAIGDSIFLTREEAEKALEKMKENEGNTF